MTRCIYVVDAHNVRPGDKVILPGDDATRIADSILRNRDGVVVTFTNGERENFRPGAAVNIDGQQCEHCGTICDPDGYCPESEWHQ